MAPHPASCATASAMAPVKSSEGFTFPSRSCVTAWGADTMTGSFPSVTRNGGRVGKPPVIVYREALELDFRYE